MAGGEFSAPQGDMTVGHDLDQVVEEAVKAQGEIPEVNEREPQTEKVEALQESLTIIAKNRPFEGEPGKGDYSPQEYSGILVADIGKYLKFLRTNNRPDAAEAVRDVLEAISQVEVSYARPVINYQGEIVAKVQALLSEASAPKNPAQSTSAESEFRPL